MASHQKSGGTSNHVAADYTGVLYARSKRGNMIKKELLLASLEQIPPTDENGPLWYKWLFTEQPRYREYFVGDTDIHPQAVLTSERFQKVGKRFLRKIHTLAMVANNSREFRKHVADVADRHKKRHHVERIDMLQTVGPIFMEFLASRVTLDAETRKEWDAFWANFNKEIQRAGTGVSSKISITDFHAPTF